MAAHSNILAWRIPWTEELGRLVNGVTESDTTEQLTLSRFVIAFLPRSKCLIISWLQVTIFSDFGAQENKICHCFHFLPFYLPWSDGTRCHDLSFSVRALSQLFHSALSPSSRGSLVPLHFLQLELYNLHIWGCYFSQQSWFQLVIHPAWLFTWCTLHIS